MRRRGCRSPRARRPSGERHELEWRLDFGGQGSAETGCRRVSRLLLAGASKQRGRRGQSSPPLPAREPRLGALLVCPLAQTRRELFESLVPFSPQVVRGGSERRSVPAKCDCVDCGRIPRVLALNGHGQLKAFPVCSQPKQGAEACQLETQGDRDPLETRAERTRIPWCRGGQGRPKLGGGPKRVGPQSQSPSPRGLRGARFTSEPRARRRLAPTLAQRAAPSGKQQVRSPQEASQVGPQGGRPQTTRRRFDSP